MTMDTYTMPLILLMVCFLSMTIEQKTDDPTESCSPIRITCLCLEDSHIVNRSVVVKTEKLIRSSLFQWTKLCSPLKHPYEACKEASCELSPNKLGTIGGGKRKSIIFHDSKPELRTTKEDSTPANIFVTKAEPETTKEENSSPANYSVTKAEFLTEPRSTEDALSTPAHFSTKTAEPGTTAGQGRFRAVFLNRKKGPVNHRVVFSNGNGGVHNGHRSARDAQSCRLPRTLEHANVKCKNFTNVIYCIIECSFGYALRSPEDNVFSKQITCDHSENKWKPHGFQDCEAFLNCKVHLVSAGTLHCNLPATGIPYCDIGCHEAGKETMTRRYECRDRNYGITLPRCARLNKYEQLINAPYYDEYYMYGDEE